MINLITGVPGSGKTVYSMVFMLEAYNEGRPIYVHGIPDLKIEHTQVICSSPTCGVCPPKPMLPQAPDLPDNELISDPVLKAINKNKHKNYLKRLLKYEQDLKKYNSILKAERWNEWAPDGAFIFYDEVQNVYRPRSSGKEVPKSVAAFETHRHKGLDFFLVSQAPLLFDSNIRRLVNKHIHLRPTWAGRYQYEYPECNDQPKNTTSGIKSKYKLNKKVFSLFKSASLHTKQSKKIPLSFYLIFVALFILAALMYRLNTRYSGHINPETKIEAIPHNEESLKGNPEIKEDIDLVKDQFGMAMLTRWVKNGVPESEYDYAPKDCVFSRKTLKCPPYTIDSQILKQVRANTLCSNGGACFAYFPIVLASLDSNE